MSFLVLQLSAQQVERHDVPEFSILFEEGLPVSAGLEEVDLWDCLCQDEHLVFQNEERVGIDETLLGYSETVDAGGQFVGLRVFTVHGYLFA